MDTLGQWGRENRPLLPGPGAVNVKARRGVGVPAQTTPKHGGSWRRQRLAVSDPRSNQHQRLKLPDPLPGEEGLDLAVVVPICEFDKRRRAASTACAWVDSPRWNASTEF